MTRATPSSTASRAGSSSAAGGCGPWRSPVRLPSSASSGSTRPTFDAPFTPAVEVGWRLARRHWGHGYATEGARAALDFGFDALALDEIVSFTTHGNTRSRDVMGRLGMHHDPADDFDNPNVAAGDSLRRHVLYRLDRAGWQRNRPPAAR